MMNKYGQRCCPPKKKRKKHCINKKLGFMMIALGAISILALFLPLKYWVLLLSGSLVVFGCTLLKK
jgi:hypothetical protein